MSAGMQSSLAQLSREPDVVYLMVAYELMYLSLSVTGVRVRMCISH